MIRNYHVSLKCRALSRALILAVIACLVATQFAAGTTITVKNGSQYQGKFALLASLAESPLKPNGKNGETVLKLIAFIHDDLRRTYVSKQNVTAVTEDPPVAQERIKIEQVVAQAGRRIGSLGPILGITPFDKFGRRTFTTSTEQGRLDIVQGITEITSTYTKIEGLLVKNPVVCETRMATTSLPRETLSLILANFIDPKSFEDRLRIVRLYTQAERYEDAREELKLLLNDFSDRAELAKHVSTLHQLGANRLVREIEHRSEAGQHNLAVKMLASFPAEDVAGETLIRVRDKLAEYERLRSQGKKTIDLIDEHLAKVSDAQSKEKLQPLCDEIKNDLNFHNLDRFADYLRLADDPQLSPDQKLAIAVGGWLLGSGGGGENLAVALSLVQVRDDIRSYLRGERKADRDQALENSRSLETNTPEYVAKIIAHMKPPIDTEPLFVDSVVGLLHLTVKGIDDQPEFHYLVQLPPEYDPYRRYPCVVTLNGSGSSELQQIDWWSGSYSPNLQMRMGQGARHGFIVIAPVWTQPHQRKYEFTFREHAAVLFSLRDASQRFSIDTDRVFLSGHSMGGDAAWDIALSHPDLWCGVIPIVASHAKYIVHYHENAKGLPLYFVCGEMDGKRLEDNGSQFDRYLTRPGYECTVVEYLGRGHENFQDEIQRIFSWMAKLPRRDFFPRKFEFDTMRRSDNFFWWVELSDFPPQNTVSPELFGHDSKTRPTKSKAEVLNNNRLTLTTGAGRVTIWLSPEMVSFERKISIVVDGKVQPEKIAPSVEVILEDVRTRGDRLHPFWAKLVTNASRRK